MYLSGKWDQMMLAEAEDLNILYDHELIMPLMENGVIYNISHILLVTLCKE